MRFPPTAPAIYSQTVDISDEHIDQYGADGATVLRLNLLYDQLFVKEAVRSVTSVNP